MSQINNEQETRNLTAYAQKSSQIVNGQIHNIIKQCEFVHMCPENITMGCRNQCRLDQFLKVMILNQWFKKMNRFICNYAKFAIQCRQL